MGTLVTAHSFHTSCYHFVFLSSCYHFICTRIVFLDIQLQSYVYANDRLTDWVTRLLTGMVVVASQWPDAKDHSWYGADFSTNCCLLLLQHFYQYRHELANSCDAIIHHVILGSKANSAQSLDYNNGRLQRSLASHVSATEAKLAWESEGKQTESIHKLFLASDFFLRIARASCYLLWCSSSSRAASCCWRGCSRCCCGEDKRNRVP